MFRYIALIWKAGAEAASAVSRRLAVGLEGSADWRVVLDRPGLQVFSTGERPGVHQAYALDQGRGVVLGRLFSRHGPAPSADHFGKHPGESAEAVRTSGQLLIDQYWGRYVAFLELGDGDHCVLRDPSGTLPCFRMGHDGVEVVYSWLDDVLTAMPLLPLPAVNWECLTAHMAFGELTGHATALEGITQVLAGELVHVGADRSKRSIFLWKATDHAHRDRFEDPAQASDALHQTVVHCVQSWAFCYDAILLRLSGGIDSSILVSCLAEGRTRTRVTCLNYHSPGADSDERHYARLAAAHAHRELVEFERDDSFRLEQVLDVALTPSPISYLGRFGARRDAELASRIGARAMFTGAGGDQLFFEFHHWWPAADYLRIRGVDQGLPAAMMSAARLGKVSVWRAAGLALADRFRGHLPPPLMQRPWALATEALWAPLRQAERFSHPALAETAGLPIGKLMQVQQLLHFGAYYDPYLREAAPELVNPLLSQPLVELCLRIPTYLLTLGGRGRGLARHAFAGDLPPEITRRRSKGGMEELIDTILQHNIAFARQALLDGELVRQGLLDRGRVERALAGASGASAVRAGEIHMFIGVEAWLRRWSASSRPHR